MKLDYSVTNKDFDVKKENKKDNLKQNIKTRTSMQGVVMGALSAKQPTNVGASIVMPQNTSGWGSL